MVDRDPAEQARLYETFVYRSRLADSSAEAYSRRIDRFVQFLIDGGEQYAGALTDENVRDYAVRDWHRWLATQERKANGEKLAPATMQQHMTAINSFYEWLGLGRPRGVRIDVPKAERRGLVEADLRKLMRAAKVSGARDYALLATMAYAGLRVGETHALEADDVAITARTGQMEVRYGKGGATRKVPLNGALRLALEGWLDERPGDRHTGPLWITRTGSQMAARTIQRTVESLGQKSGVEVTPHTLRHTFARRLMESGAPIPDVQKLMGHRSVSTTAGYGNASPEELERAVEYATVDGV